MMNRVFVKAFLPMLPPRFSTMIGELAWNPWQWGDVRPQRRSGSNIRSREDENVGQDERTSPVKPVPPPPHAPSWKFLSQMQLSTSKSSANGSSEMSLNPAAIELIEPVRELVQSQNATKSQEKLSESSAVYSDDTERTAVSTEQDVVTEKDERLNSKMPTHQVSEDVGSNKGKNVFGRLEEKASELSTSRPLVLPPASASHPNDAQISTPLTVFGLENNKATKTSSSEESAQNRYDDGTVESQLFLQENTNQTWLPSMMDKKDYDFRDRRLDY